MIYLDENGITIKASKEAVIGKEYELNGKKYKVVDEEMLREMVKNEENVTKVVTSKVTNMEWLFNDESYFFDKTDNWFVKITNEGGSSFNQDISAWDVGNVESMEGMFAGTESFNQDIGKWNVRNVTNMKALFMGATNFNQDLSSWDVSKVTNMNRMFAAAYFFNQDLSSWDVSNVTDMGGMFYETKFNKDISSWNVNKVQDMSGMFFNSSFNQNINNWDVTNVTDMRGINGDKPNTGINERWTNKVKTSDTQLILIKIYYEHFPELAYLGASFMGSGDEFSEFNSSWAEFKNGDKIDGNGYNALEIIYDLIFEYFMSKIFYARFNSSGACGAIGFDFMKKEVTLEVREYLDENDPDYAGDDWNDLNELPTETFT